MNCLDEEHDSDNGHAHANDNEACGSSMPVNAMTCHAEVVQSRDYKLNDISIQQTQNCFLLIYLHFFQLFK